MRIGWALAAGLIATGACVRRPPDVRQTARLPDGLGYGVGASPGRTCRDPTAREFDFWVGRWAITDATGALAGRSEVRRALEGCAVIELFAGGMGRSLSFFDPTRGEWTQDYVDHRGLTLRLFGRRTGGVMAMSDSIRVIPGGPRMLNRFEWQDANGGARQVWRMSLDGGTTWTVNFDGRYRPDSAAPGAPPEPGICRERAGYHALDGLLGRWRVEVIGGVQVGIATITKTTGDCLIEEDVAGPDGYTLKAFLYYDRYVRTWHRVQADSRGAYVHLAGQPNSDGRRLSGVRLEGPVETPIQLRWELLGPDVVVQHWERPGATGGPEPVVSLRWTRQR